MLDSVTAQIVAVSAFLATLFGLIKLLHLPEIGKGLLIVVRDWRGEAPRPGYEGRSSFPERMADQEKRQRDLAHFVRGEVASRLSLIDEALTTIDQRTLQLERNGGSSLADTVHRSADKLEAVSETVERLEVTAQQNREGIIDVSRRVGAQEERITDHRRRNEQTIAELRAFLERERDDLLVAKQSLEASVAELLMVEGHQQREQHPPGQEP